MSSTMSKRQQARNEKALQDLVHKVPGNNICADCSARNPAWASWSLGIFLCLRCASIHRKLGTHISKVKSLSMDGWSNDQVENMKQVGNITSNKTYNSENKKPPVPIDADEADSAMERFIRSKYIRSPTALNGAKEMGRHDTGRTTASTESDEGPPPPLPPKTGGSFFKKTSTFPLSFRSKKTPQNPREAPQLRSKPSKVFGATVSNDSPEDMAKKLTQLRDMGFIDDKRNAMILKGVNGNLEKAIESLVRLGEGGGSSPSVVAPRKSSLPTSRSLTPGPLATPTTAGLSNLSPAANASPATSNNPWDIPPPPPPQSSQSTGTLQNTNPFYSNNPFGMPAQQPQFELNQSMQNLSLAPPSQQPLFPHHTGPAPPLMQQPIYQESINRPASQNQNFASVAFNSSQTYSQPFGRQQQNYNPFLQAHSSEQASQQLSVNTSSVQNQNQGVYGSNPFTRSPTRIASPTLHQIPEQTQQNYYGSQQSNPFFSMNQPAQTQGFNQGFNQQQQAQPTQPQAFDQVFGHQQQAQPQYNQVFSQQQQAQPAQPAQPQYDQSFYQSQQQPEYQPQRSKADILALFNYPSLAPAPLQPQADQSATSADATQRVVQTAAQAPQQRSVSTPLPGNKNPFMNGGSSPPPAPSVAYNNAAHPSPFGSTRSRESMTLGMEMAWNNGRHSPDAFASLSARSS